MIDVWALHAPEFCFFLGKKLKFTENWSALENTAGLSSSTTKLVKFPVIMQLLYTGYFSKDMPEAPYHSHELLMLHLNCKSQLSERGDNLGNVFY